MITEKNFARFAVFADDTIAYAMQKISNNRSGIVFVITQNGVLEGVLTDGDLRRWLLEAADLDLSSPVFEATNKEFVSAFENATASEIEQLFSNKIEYVPLLNRQSRLVAVASKEQKEIQIADFVISQTSSAFLIAEIGNNHNGDFDLAKTLVDEAKNAGANCAKFQLRDMQSMYRTKSVSVAEDLGAEYTLDLLSRFQLRIEQMYQLFDYCKHVNIIPLCTPWDFVSLQALETYGMQAYKVASADLTNHDLLRELAKTRKPLLCSTGMSTEVEIKDAVNVLQQQGAQFILLHCNSTYPAPFKDVNLRYLDRLKDMSCSELVGYSGHERGIAIATAAVSLGAKVIEKHFTLDRDMEGNDHKVSLLPAEFSQMVKSIREIELALGSNDERKVTQGEMMNREVLGKSLISTRLIKNGDTITQSDIETKSPGKGLASYQKSNLIGKIANREIAPGDFFYPSDLNIASAKAGNYRFSRPFGVPVRFHDFASILGKTNLDLVEFHFSYKDLNLDPAGFLDATGYDMDFVVHSPELFSGDHVMDLCSDDQVYRQRSIRELRLVVEKTLDLKRYFHRSSTPLIIINAGGFSLDSFIPKDDRQKKYDLIAEAIKSVNAKGAEIIPQTMPPYPWHFGGQRYHNLFLNAQEIVSFCHKTGLRVCLDISHSKLACNFEKASFAEFIKLVSPFTAHLHVVDAEDIDGEGLQIGDGEIDFKQLSSQLHQHAPNASFIPEVWQGHKNEGEGFWQALELLERNNF